MNKVHKRVVIRGIICLCYLLLAILMFVTGRTHTLLMDNKGNQDGSFSAINGMTVVIDNTTSEELMKNATILCLMRENGSESIVRAAKAEFEEVYGAKIKILKYSPLPVSSSEVRQKCADGEDFSDLVTEEVYTYIKENNLYKD